MSTTQYYFGIDEIAEVYDSGGSEEDDLVQNGTERIKELANKDVFEIGVDPEIEVSIGDIVGGRDYLSGMTMKAPVWSKIIKYSAGEISIEYKLEEDRMTVEEDNLSKSSIKTIEEIKLLEKQQLKVDKTDELIKEEVKE